MANTIFNTGVNEQGVPLPGNALDRNWKLISGPGVTTPQDVYVLLNQAPGGYFSTTDSRWVWFDPKGYAKVDQPYVFQQTFFLNLDFAQVFALISGRWGADNYGYVTINGISPTGWWSSGEISLPPPDPPDNFVRPHDFSISGHFALPGAFINGENTLEITVFDSGVQREANPSGFNLSGAGIYLIARPEAR